MAWWAQRKPVQGRHMSYTTKTTAGLHASQHAVVTQPAVEVSRDGGQSFRAAPARSGSFTRTSVHAACQRGPWPHCLHKPRSESIAPNMRSIKHIQVRTLRLTPRKLASALRLRQAIHVQWSDSHLTRRPIGHHKGYASTMAAFWSGVVRLRDTDTATGAIDIQGRQSGRIGV